MPLFGIGEFFKRVQSRQAKEVFVRSVVAQALKKLFGEDVPLEKIVPKNGVVSLLGISPAMKSAIFIKKAKLLAEINSNQQVIFISDVR